MCVHACLALKDAARMHAVRIREPMSDLLLPLSEGTLQFVKSMLNPPTIDTL